MRFDGCNNVKNDGHAVDISKIFAENEGTATESLSSLQ